MIDCQYGDYDSDSDCQYRDYGSDSDCLYRDYDSDVDCQDDCTSKVNYQNNHTGEFNLQGTGAARARKREVLPAKWFACPVCRHAIRALEIVTIVIATPVIFLGTTLAFGAGGALFTRYQYHPVVASALS